MRELKSPAWFPVGGAQRARSTGMTAGGDGFAAVAGGPALHIPVLGRPALDFLNVRDGGVYIDATFGAGGYTRAILAAADCPVIGIDRDQSAIALGADLVQAADGRLTLIEERFANLDAVAREARLRQRSTAWCSISASPPCSSTMPRAASPSASTGRSTCAWAARGRARPMWSTRRASAISPTSFSFSARSAIRAPSPAPSSRRAPRRRSAPRARSPISSPRSVRSRPGDIHPATRTFQALAHFRQ